MNAHVRDCLVVGFERLIPTLHLPDPDDRHVLAAAIHASADVIVLGEPAGDGMPRICVSTSVGWDELRRGMAISWRGRLRKISE